MIRQAALIAAMATPCHADPRAFWGGSSAVLYGCAEADACVFVQNKLTGGPDVAVVTITAGEFTVTVEAVMGPGTMPDHIRVIVPPGFLVLPPEADIPEDGSQVFKIFFPLVG